MHIVMVSMVVVMPMVVVKLHGSECGNGGDGCRDVCGYVGSPLSLDAVLFHILK